jgi:hypothetical protein
MRIARRSLRRKKTQERCRDKKQLNVAAAKASIRYAEPQTAGRITSRAQASVKNNEIKIKKCR